ncbi:hypothetical protein GGTG_00469 [Gaeumannomyces tritici R3-111a-1]|uniref:Uncharacterized protein n=1 Tax=Gaeumannomyces tritici (strain R3-111a-1) TaxID=644352 RepID=J3NGT0_GAET3|nr:hypothetical protein GGTG_00469 [Gaeumannomyces tritici R3-111a-1]EJT80470.1 hypothetical protein GGTG_00469 [Gaeumannomyces tritici R3-111a-1]
MRSSGLPSAYSSGFLRMSGGLVGRTLGEAKFERPWPRVNEEGSAQIKIKRVNSGKWAHDREGESERIYPEVRRE